MRSGRIDPLGRLQLFLYQMRIGYTDIPFDPIFLPQGHYSRLPGY